MSEVSFHLALCSTALFDAEKETSGMGVRQIHPQTICAGSDFLVASAAAQGGGFCGFSPGPWMCPLELGVPGLWLAPGFAGKLEKALGCQTELL